MTTTHYPDDSHILLDAMMDRFTKLKSMMQVANSEEFTEFDKPTIQGYLWAMQDLLNELIEIGDHCCEKIYADLATNNAP